MCGAKQSFLVSFASRHLGDDFASEQNNRPVAHQGNFRKLGREQQHGRPGVGHLAQQPINLMLGADVDAARRIEAKQCLESRRNPSRDHHLLLVTAAQSAQLGLRSGVDLQSLDSIGNALTFRSGVDEAPIRRVAYKRQSHVLADRALRQKRLQSIRRDEHKACSDCIARMIELQLTAVDRDLSAVVTGHSSNAVEQFLLPLTFEHCDPENLSGPQAEGHVLEHVAVANIADLESGEIVVAAAIFCRCTNSEWLTFVGSRPSISETIRSPLPGAVSMTPTVAPSRKTVARSQSAPTSAIR